MILLLGITSSLTAVAVLFWTITIYIPAIAEDFNVGGDAQRTPVIIAFMVGSLLSALAGPLAGHWMDTRGARETILVGSVVAAGALLLTSQATELWQICAGWAVVSLARTLLFPVPYSWLVTRWFSKRRPMVLGVLTIGFGLGGILVLPLSLVEERWDWSIVMIVSAGIVLLSNGLLALIFVHDRPADVGLEVEGVAGGDEAAAKAEATGFTIREALSTPAFWLMSVGFSLFFIAPASFSTLQLDFFETSGVKEAALVVAIAAMVRGSSRLPFGLLLGRIQRVYLLAVIVALTQALAVLVIVNSTSMPSIVIFVLLWGLGGAFVPMLEPILVTRTFGVKQFGTIMGSVMMIAFPGTAIGPIVGGVMFDATGSYTLPFSLLVVSLVISSGFFAITGLVVNGTRHRQASIDRGMPIARNTSEVNANRT